MNLLCYVYEEFILNVVSTELSWTTYQTNLQRGYISNSYEALRMKKNVKVNIENVIPKKGVVNEDKILYELGCDIDVSNYSE